MCSFYVLKTKLQVEVVWLYQHVCPLVVTVKSCLTGGNGAHPRVKLKADAAVRSAASLFTGDDLCNQLSSCPT